MMPRGRVANVIKYKDYTNFIAPYSIIGGAPAKLLKVKAGRIFDVDLEHLLISNSEYISELTNEDIIESTKSLIDYR